jgi:hypothetical protein
LPLSYFSYRESHILVAILEFSADIALRPNYHYSYCIHTRATFCIVIIPRSGPSILRIIEDAAAAHDIRAFISIRVFCYRFTPPTRVSFQLKYWLKLVAIAAPSPRREPAPFQRLYHATSSDLIF